MNSPLTELIFWLSLGLILYTYIGYPLILAVILSMKNHSRRGRSADSMPSVTLVISMYNEEKILEGKVRNLSEIDYPSDRLEILIGSDGSSDATAKLLQQVTMPNLRVCVFQHRRGKASVLNDLVEMATGEIIVFSDANTMFQRETVRLLVGPFEEKETGGVSGELVLEGQGNTGESLYWKYETFVKRLESTVHTLVGATGGVYAIRRNLYEPLPSDRSIADDFVTPLRVVERGYQVRYVPDAVAVEQGEESVMGEFQRKVRIGAQNFNAIPLFKSLLDPSRGFVAFALWSHKVIRWIVPFLLVALAGATIVLEPLGIVYRWSFIIEVAFCLAAAVGIVSERWKFHNPVFTLPYYFLAMNTALFLGFLRSILGSQSPTWEVQR